MHEGNEQAGSVIMVDPQAMKQAFGPSCWLFQPKQLL